jgi:hypothetical protein
MLILFFLAEDAGRSAAAQNTPRGNLIAIFLFALMAAIIIGLGAIVGYKAFQSGKKKKQ